MEQNAIVELRGVSLYHNRDSFRTPQRGGQQDLVLSDVNLTINSGELVYLIGRVGSGKSTLLKTLYGELPLVEGSGQIVGYDLGYLRRRDIPYLRRRMGIVFQDYQLLTDRNLYQNLHFVLKATGWKNEYEIRQKISEVMSRVGLLNKEYKMPFQLSGGEQQRLAIARALLNDPGIILADEPTGNLDPAATDEIMHLFQTIVEQGCAVMMATHNIGIIQQYPSRTLRFNQGKIEEIDIVSILGY